MSDPRDYIGVGFHAPIGSAGLLEESLDLVAEPGGFEAKRFDEADGDVVHIVFEDAGREVEVSLTVDQRRWDEIVEAVEEAEVR